MNIKKVGSIASFCLTRILKLSFSNIDKRQYQTIFCRHFSDEHMRKTALYKILQVRLRKVSHRLPLEHIRLQELVFVIQPVRLIQILLKRSKDNNKITKEELVVLMKILRKSDLLKSPGSKRGKGGKKRK